jgi:dTDP-4-dehydrorhamnose 3,5-epimerase
MLEVRPLGLHGLFELRPPRFGDARGYFSEVWNREAMRSAGFDLDFVQDNHSYSAEKGILRGLHFQTDPFAQDKLVRVTRGSVFDVAVDIRRNSITFGKWEGLILSAELWNQILIPAGFAHGFVTLEEHSEVQYKVTAAFSPEHDRSVRFDDPAIGIEWPRPDEGFRLSEKDRSAPFLADLPSN